MPPTVGAYTGSPKHCIVGITKRLNPNETCSPKELMRLKETENLQPCRAPIVKGRIKETLGPDLWMRMYVYESEQS